TAPPGVAAVPQEAPAVNPNAPILSGAGSAVLPEAQAAARRAEAEKKKDRLPVVAIVAIAALTLFGGVVGVRTHRRRSSA
ncbi:MAG TPA: hypothetical protein VG034_20825, partial [Acidimicrobiia bacterium]|nr:hypothetical protein [Acidimicrobiia bacterium]